MALPGDPRPEDHDLDAEIGFCTPQSLIGQPVAQSAGKAAGYARAEEPDLDLFAPAEPALPALDPVAETATGAARADSYSDSGSDEDGQPGLFEPVIAAAPGLEAPFAADRGRADRGRGEFSRHGGPDRAPMGLYAIYVLVLLAVPTFGVSALIGLLAVSRRDVPTHPLTASHFVYLQRTLWGSAVAALAGAVLIVVNVGVFVLFLTAVWVLVRGTYGVMKLKGHHSIPNPRSWLI